MNLLNLYFGYITNILLRLDRENFHSRRWGSSLTICAYLTACSSPHRHEQKFSGARVCIVTFKHLLQLLRSHILSFGTPGQLFKIPPFSAQKSHSAGGKGDPRIFCYLGAHAKLQNPTTTPAGRISNVPEEEREREEEEKKMPFIVATYVYASSQGPGTHSARQRCKKWWNRGTRFPESILACRKLLDPRRETLTVIRSAEEFCSSCETLS
jgi:hypothetical protein